MSNLWYNTIGDNMNKSNKNKYREEESQIVNIDFDLFKTEEIIVIYHFLSLIEKNNKHPVNPKVLVDEYNKYRKVINSIALEKKYDKEFFKKTGISIYHTVQEAQKLIKK